RPARKGAARPAPASAADVQELRQALAAQQQRIQQLVQQLQQQQAAFQQAQEQSQQQLQQAQAAAADAQAKASAFNSASAQEKSSLDKLSSDVTDVGISVASNAASDKEAEKRVKAIEGLLGRFRFAGDVRLRGESFFQNCAGCAQRN